MLKNVLPRTPPPLLLHPTTTTLQPFSPSPSVTPTLTTAAALTCVNCSRLPPLAAPQTHKHPVRRPCYPSPATPVNNTDLCELLPSARHAECQQEGVLVPVHVLVHPLMVRVEQPQVLKHLTTTTTQEGEEEDEEMTTAANRRRSMVGWV